MTTSSSKRLLQASSVVLTALGAIALGLVGCGRNIQAASGQAHGAILWIVGLDNTRSIPEQTRDEFYLELARQAGKLQPQDRLCLLLVNSRLTELFDNSPLPGTEANLRLLKTEMGFAADRQDGTLAERFWSEAAHRTELAGARSVVVTLLSDGENSDQSAQSMAHIRQAARRLRGYRQVAAVEVVGVRNMHRAYLRGCLGVLGSRLQMLGTSEAYGQAIAEALASARVRR